MLSNANVLSTTVQPEGDKSATQKAGDTVRGGSDDAEGQGKSFLDSTKDTLSGAGESIQNTLGGKK
jgi:hypothetical protein